MEEFAKTLEKIAQKLREEGQFTFIQGTKQINISPNDQLKATYEYVIKGDKHSFEIQIDWLESSKGYAKMGIE